MHVLKRDELIPGVSEAYATVIAGGRCIPAGMWPVIDGGLSAAQHVLSNFRNAFGEAIAFEVRRVFFQHMLVRMHVWYDTSLIAEVARALIGIKMFIGRFGRPPDDMSQVVEAFGMSDSPLDPYSRTLLQCVPEVRLVRIGPSEVEEHFQWGSFSPMEPEPVLAWPFLGGEPTDLGFLPARPNGGPSKPESPGGKKED